MIPTVCQSIHTNTHTHSDGGHRNAVTLTSATERGRGAERQRMTNERAKSREEGLERKNDHSEFDQGLVGHRANQQHIYKEEHMCTKNVMLSFFFFFTHL